MTEKRKKKERPMLANRLMVPIIQFSVFVHVLCACGLHGGLCILVWQNRDSIMMNGLALKTNWIKLFCTINCMRSFSYV